MRHSLELHLHLQKRYREIHGASLAVHLKAQFLARPSTQQNFCDLRGGADGLTVYANDDVSAEHLGLLADHDDAPAGA